LRHPEKTIAPQPGNCDRGRIEEKLQGNIWSLLPPYLDDLVKSLFSPQRSQRKYFYFQQVISVGFVLSVVNFQLLRIQHILRIEQNEEHRHPGLNDMPIT
jgi:hypothetical protein